jgi:HrpA-like RNA helicase
LFDKKVKDKLILATNIGESSITLPFCRAVVDYCLSRRNCSRQNGVTKLETHFASKASMTQRAGRVGRVADGQVFRMITREFYEGLAEF